MLFSTLVILALGSAGVSSSAVHKRGGLQPRQDNGNAKGGKGGNGGGAQCLTADVIQSASTKTGQEPGTDGIKPGQAKSATDANNFISFCAGQKLTNGVQVTTGSCNPIPMGKIPATANMISAMITFPQPGDTVTAGKTFNISVQTAHLDAGTFVNPTTNYYTAPQTLNKQGDIIGHCHVTVQSIGDLKSTTPPDPTTFAFFKGIDDAGNGAGLLQATVTDGLPAGAYRVCTMIAASNHQPVNMPVAQRGAQDDCTKFVVTANGADKGAEAAAKKNAGTANKGKMATGKVDGAAVDQ